MTSSQVLETRAFDGHAPPRPRLVSVTKGWPRCWECHYAPLCDGYWMADIEVLARTGYAERARLLVALECGVRMDTLQSLLTETHAQAVAAANGPTIATYSRGALQVQSGAQK